MWARGVDLGWGGIFYQGNPLLSFPLDLLVRRSADVERGLRLGGIFYEGDCVGREGAVWKNCLMIWNGCQLLLLSFDTQAKRLFFHHKGHEEHEDELIYIVGIFHCHAAYCNLYG